MVPDSTKTKKKAAVKPLAPSGPSARADEALALFHPITAQWFRAVFDSPTAPQIEGWPAIARGDSTLILSPTGSGKTLTAFLWCLDRLMFAPIPAKAARCRVLYVSPLKALAVDVERNLRGPLTGIRQASGARAIPPPDSSVAMRSADPPAYERRNSARTPPDILIPTPESLFLTLTSAAR